MYLFSYVDRNDFENGLDVSNDEDDDEPNTDKEDFEDDDD